MLLKHLPWKYVLRRTAKAYGVLDPVNWLASMRRFAQPSEVAEPLDLLRAGVAFHARGLINTRAIQHNLDWIWPYWVERQFNPLDCSFIPRAFSLSHVNHTHRNWTAVGLPDTAVYPIVDPRGLTTPLYDGWSVDAWIVTDRAGPLLPSRTPDAVQRSVFSHGWQVETRIRREGALLSSRVHLEGTNVHPRLVMRYHAFSKLNAQLVVSVRPYNPEGIQFIYRLVRTGSRRLCVNDETTLVFDPAPDAMHFSTYAQGDVYHHISASAGNAQAQCPVGMATGAAVFPLTGRTGRGVSVRVDLTTERRRQDNHSGRPPETWPHALADATRLVVPDPRIRYLFNCSLRTLLLLSAGRTVPGPYTYRRFWYRDAVMMHNAMLTLNLVDRCRRHLDTFFEQQQRDGYFASQRGEWDANGQVLWLFHRFHQVAPELFLPRWVHPLVLGAAWIRNKLTDTDGSAHAGLLPAGFSAEHFGPNDYYYWDDFWSIAGLDAAARLAETYLPSGAGAEIFLTARRLEAATFRSIAGINPDRSRGGIPASAYRRMDAGAVGALSADYPLQLLPPGHPRITATVAFLLDNCFVRGGFFQDMIHSGINAYLTLAIAQTLLRNRDPRYRQLVQTVADLASGTGQWPEAVHPATGGGCMGDGHHGWAAAEWVLMIRNMFLREEEQTLVVGPGLLAPWLKDGNTLFLGPTRTAFGPVNIRLTPDKSGCDIHLECRWNGKQPRVLVRIPGFQQTEMSSGRLRVHRSPATR